MPVSLNNAERTERMKRTRILVAGGTGLVGKALSRWIRRNNHKDVVEMSVLSRGHGGDVRWNELKDQRGRFDVVVNLSGSRFLDPLVMWNETTRKEIRESRVGTAERLREFVDSDEKIRKFVQITGVGIYPYSDTATYDENVQINRLDGDFFQNLVMDWENASQTTKDRTTVIRSGVVLSKDGGALKEQLLLYKLGFGTTMGQGHNFFPWIHEDDLAKMILHAATLDGNVPVMNGVAPTTTTQSEFCHQLKRVLGRPQWFPPTGVPEFVVKLMFGGADRANFLIKGMDVKPEAVKRSGFKFEYETVGKALEALLG